jgi:hypothetical protein
MQFRWRLWVLVPFLWWVASLSTANPDLDHPEPTKSSTETAAAAQGNEDMSIMGVEPASGNKIEQPSPTQQQQEAVPSPTPAAGVVTEHNRLASVMGKFVREPPMAVLQLEQKDNK